MAAIKADRRLYETAEKDALVEEGDVRGRYLLAGIGSRIGPSDVEKYKLKERHRRVWYPGCPDFPRLTVPELKELGYHEDKKVRAHEDKMALARTGKTVAELEAEEEEASGGSGVTIVTAEEVERREAAADQGADDAGEEDAADDDVDEGDHSDRNEEEESEAGADEGSAEEAETLPDWPLSSTPAEYLKRYGDDAPNSELAQQHVDAEGTGAG